MFSGTAETAGTALTRAGAKVGDDIYVSGTLGDAAYALAVLQGRAALDGTELARVRERLELPEPRVGLGERLRGVATAAIDISDGLIGDLGHVLAQSRVGATLDLGLIPRSPTLAALLERGNRDLGLACMLSGGDDYELCFTTPPSARELLAAIARDVGVPLARVGSVTAATSLVVRDEKGVPLHTLSPSFDHFA